MIHLEGGFFPEGSFSDHLLFLFLFYKWMGAYKWGAFKLRNVKRQYPALSSLGAVFHFF